ncbi:hypothetical protein G3I59_27740 [Amycolatopsis rubida]|uniref:SGNH hydrolase-type esterase domain-containing protein n=1 Tax=Amycolatopsis rubida TaxID=112413 RepID=A0ABX0C2X2_9PSEU|nr:MULTISPECIES: hypothetical protein [Amycolatopsis]MYW94289.1 hypothetical protein [Amycolatopsis rubida]NEC59278.1 hypothetical protein [Amycolatopsis rubida]OAP23154.1 hypothetical protein A4R44_05800 [Amycolatopsis sp. M39]
MPATEPLRQRADRLAALLGDAAGAQILAELQKLAVRRQRPGPAGERIPELGPWRVEPDTALRRTDWPPEELESWAPVEYLPPAGDARRVVLIGESAARGWPFEHGQSCGQVLQRQLGGEGYQCVDLAKTGATGAVLNTLVDRLDLAAPDVVIAFAGNNWAEPFFRLGLAGEIEVRDTLADALREGGYAALRERFLSVVTHAYAQGFLERLAALRQRCPAEVVVVVPEFNLRGWVPPADIETPVLPPAALASWHDLKDQAGHAAETGRWAEIAPLAAAMAALDQGTSSIPGWLRGRAALATRRRRGRRSRTPGTRCADCSSGTSPGSPGRSRTCSRPSPATAAGGVSTCAPSSAPPDCPTRTCSTTTATFPAPASNAPWPPSPTPSPAALPEPRRPAPDRTGGCGPSATRTPPRTSLSKASRCFRC